MTEAKNELHALQPRRMSIRRIETPSAKEAAGGYSRSIWKRPPTLPAMNYCVGSITTTVRSRCSTKSSMS
jgi:hypothetical protein